jgi:hypothetical protein
MKTILNKLIDTALDTEEREIVDAFAQEEILPVAASKEQCAAAKAIANQTLKRDGCINIHLKRRASAAVL